MTLAHELWRRRVARGWSVRTLAAAAAVGKSTVAAAESGRPVSHTIVASLDNALAAGGALVATTEARNRRRPADEADLERVRQTIQHLVGLDTSSGGDHVAPAAERLFEDARAQLTGPVRDHVASDLTAAVAEMGEVAAWCAIDAQRHTTADRVATRAAALARSVGDSNILWLTESNRGIDHVQRWRSRDVLAGADRALLEARSPRVRALFTNRRARALAQLGAEGDAWREFTRSRSVLLGAGDGPSWSWWVDEPELLLHEAAMLADLGRWSIAADKYAEAVALMPVVKSRDRALAMARRVQALAMAGAADAAETTAEEVPAAQSARARAAIDAAASALGPRGDRLRAIQ